MKRIVVSTYCDWNNYGSIMQSIGLKKKLKEMGFESFVVKDKPAPPSKYIASMKLNKNIISTVGNVFVYLHKNEISKKYSNSLTFIRNNVDILYYNNYETLKKNPPQAEYYIAGSDQIWKPSSCHPVFFLDFVKEKPKISYAASMGTLDVPENKRDIFKKYVEDFDYISVREKDNAKVIEEQTGKNAEVHIDPAFLVSKEEWRKLQTPYDIKGPYILLYALYWDKSFNKQLKKLHKDSGINIVAICGGLSRVWANKKLFDVDPGQFLWLIDNAEAVISSSFHGVSFSIIFNKKLAAIVNPKSPSRINNVLDILGVKKLKITELTEAKIDFYEQTNKKIILEQEKAENYLKEALNNE